MDTGLSGFIKKLPLKPLSLININQISPDAYILSLPKTHDFLPGQVVAITLDASVAPRLYSLCSAPKDETMQILFSVKPEGLLTPKLVNCSKGDQLLVSTPFGAFLGDEQPAWWIASGTGVAPYRSMLRAGLDHNKKLIHGGRFAHNFYFQDEFASALNDNYIRCCSQESGDGLYHGRLTTWLHEQQQLPAHQMYYLCGSAEMVVEVRDILIGKGIAIERIMSEIYF
ncbi:MAG TPA: FAD-binding oxidoreductase [Bacteroidales bacterium]|nr:FAD-binding oxidoreductase [Bacteroidales bacterium]